LSWSFGWLGVYQVSDIFTAVCSMLLNWLWCNTMVLGLPFYPEPLSQLRALAAVGAKNGSGWQLLAAGRTKAEFLFAP
jgi:hypothetical protein